LGYKRPLRESELVVHSLSSGRFDFSSFDCGRDEYNEYLRVTASEDHKSNTGRVWIFFHVNDDSVAGYVTLAMSQLHKNESKKFSTMTSHGYIPGLLLGQMARDNRYKGRKLAQLMLDWVINEAVSFSRNIGCRLVILRADGKKAAEMYREYGFVPIPDTKRKKDMMFYDLAPHQSD
jgi:predicted GNAT family N-acyltransferase